MQKYALLDWDNTVRKGYTLYSWVDYLHKCNIIDTQLQENLVDLKYRYIKKKITHDQYAERACAEYAKAMRGKRIGVVDEIMTDYMKIDQKQIFSYIYELLSRLVQENIDVIVISGAPSRILEQYKQKFCLKKIYAFKEEVKEGKFTGKVTCNYGLNKYKKVRELIQSYEAYPFLALGDSSSDIPMLDNSKYSICVGNKLRKKEYWNIDPQKPIEEILSQCLQE